MSAVSRSWQRWVLLTYSATSSCFSESITKRNYSLCRSCSTGIFLKVAHSGCDNNSSLNSWKNCVRSQKYTTGNNNRLVTLYILTRQSIFEIFHLEAGARARARTHARTLASMKWVATGRPLRTFELFPTTPRWDSEPNSSKGTRAPSYGAA
jgi:hypothetical protein